MKDKQVNVVYETTDYKQFKVLDGNRDINPLHLDSLRKSIKRKNLLKDQPILVSKKFYVIDGQHRLAVAQSLKLPIYYIIGSDLIFEDVKIFNTTSRRWTMDDYLYAYIKLKIPQYQTFKDFKEKYALGFSTASVVLGITSHRAESAFKQGQLKIKDMDKAVAIAEKLSSFASVCTFYRQREFVCAVVRMLQIPEYDQNYMLKMLAKDPLKLTACTNTKEYLRLLEGIYNFGKSKNTLRFF